MIEFSNQPAASWDILANIAQFNRDNFPETPWYKELKPPNMAELRHVAKVFDIVPEPALGIDEDFKEQFKDLFASFKHKLFAYLTLPTVTYYAGGIFVATSGAMAGNAALTAIGAGIAAFCGALTWGSWKLANKFYEKRMQMRQEEGAKESPVGSLNNDGTSLND